MQLIEQLLRRHPINHPNAVEEVAPPAVELR
jgi:hypothetical protein